MHKERWCAKLYDDFDYTGRVNHAHTGSKNLEQFNNVASSIEVREGCIFKGYTDYDHVGDPAIITENYPNLERYVVSIQQNISYNDQFSSYTCACFGGKYDTLNRHA